MACSDNTRCDGRIIIAIDGFSGSGKSSFARAIAERLGYIFIDTGAMYRAVTLRALEAGAISKDRVDAEKLERILDGMKLEFRVGENGNSELYVDGRRADERLRSIEVSDAVSRVAALPQVRRRLAAMQQEMGRVRSVVMDGRDIGTTVFPDAELKIFLTADPAVRAARRYKELRAAGADVSLAEIERNIRERDAADQQRAVSPLRRAADAIVLDNSHMTPQEQMEWVLEQLRARGFQPSG
ncbi:MAG: (d)CMP kinase [Rikenellaceae bacterium]|nr:(d)CMP kinase [Rikenellaceae bacterium]MCL2692939.1 (d)CMP kinase [Rikenellaceae bacterium]